MYVCLCLYILYIMHVLEHLYIAHFKTGLSKVLKWYVSKGIANGKFGCDESEIGVKLVER